MTEISSRRLRVKNEKLPNSEQLHMITVILTRVRGTVVKQNFGILFNKATTVFWVGSDMNHRTFTIDY